MRGPLTLEHLHGGVHSQFARTKEAHQRGVVVRGVHHGARDLQLVPGYFALELGQRVPLLLHVGLRAHPDVRSPLRLQRRAHTREGSHPKAALFWSACRKVFSRSKRPRFTSAIRESHIHDIHQQPFEVLPVGANVQHSLEAHCPTQSALFIAASSSLLA